MPSPQNKQRTLYLITVIMRTVRILLFLIAFYVPFICNAFTRDKDTTANKNIYNNVDTTFIQSFRKFLTTKVVLTSRYNGFSLTDTAGRKLGYKINPKTNFGFGIGYKGIGFEIQFSPKAFGNNRDDNVYGTSQQFSISSSGNGRRFIYDAYLRTSQGFYNTQAYKIPGDTTGKTQFLKRSDMVNFNLGAEVVYIFNNKRFSSSAPYNFTQRQKRGAGTALLGTMLSVYTISADSVIFPDSMKNKFSSEVQFKNAGCLIYGFSFGYTYTFVFGKRKYWFANIYTLPGLAVQQYYATNAYSEATKSRVTLGIPFQYRFAIGYNRTRYFFGLAVLGNNYDINTEKGANFSYKNGTVRLYYGYRFALKKEYFTKYLK
ncbi:MAG: DUF4421 family protein [Bacteroidia bacterium]|jgi:hypothetical protein